jgi:exopolysaccharide production protein ExoQ
MRSKFLNNVMEIVAITMILFLANIRAMRFFSLYPATATLGGQAWREVFLWVLTAGLAFWLLIRRKMLNDYVAAWKKHWPLFLFIGIAFLSLSWSVSPGATLYRALVLLFSSLLGAYIGLRYNIRELLKILSWFGVVVVVFCFALALRFPGFGTAEGSPYWGAWNGIFWHRNHMGSILALLNSVFLTRILLGLRERGKTMILDAIFYLLSIALVVLSRSATGYILLILLNFLVLLVWAWLKARDRLRPLHYYLVLGGFIVVGVLISLNFDFVMGLLNRSSSLTGRVPMWMYLLEHVINQRPWFGYGFGAIWTIETFRIQVQHAVEWPSPVLIGDNGFIDILLHVGIVGLAIFLVNFILMYVATIKLAFRRRTLEDFFPLVVMVYALAANISFSLFLEVEAFIWLLMVAGWFAAEADLKHSGSSPD